jgi:hypothetical protein
MEKMICVFNIKAQALTELAVFGSIILLLLGILLNYGLRYNYQQQIMQRAFRTAYGSAGAADSPDQPISTQHVLVRDIHIPDPQNPFAVGSLNPVMGSASLMRSFSANFPENSDELPALLMDINPGPYDEPESYAMAGLRRAQDVTPGQKKKYELIYGFANLDFVANEGADHWQAPEWDPVYKHDYCVAEDAQAGNEPCTYTLTILDNCDGNILYYDSAVARCRLITDYAACVESCEDDPSMPASQCESTCGEQIDVPWYCNRAALDNLFAVSAGGDPRSLGLQPGYQEDLVSNNVLSKTESPGGISTTDTLDWSATRTRRIIFRAMGDPSGTPITGQSTKELYQEGSSTFSTSN